MVTPPVAGFLAAGFALIPIPSGEKGPRTPGWQRREAAVFGADNAGRFAGHNAGLVHEWSRTCAIDVDDFDAADGWLTARGIDLERLFVVDDAVSVTSGRPNHGKLLYRLPEGVDPLPTFKVKADDAHVILEFRCAGSQDVIFGKHPGGTDYSVTGDPAAMAELPVALLAVWRGLVAQPKAAEKRVNGQRAQVGGRNEMLTREAGKLRRIGLSPDELAAALHQLNASRCDPPLPDVEVDTIARSIGAKPPGEQHEEGTKRAEPVISWIRFDELADREPPPRKWIVPDWLPAGDLTALFALGATGKSLLAQQVSTLVAKGRPIFGNATLAARVMGIYCEESHDELWRRQFAICERLGIGMMEVSDNLFLEGRRGMNNVLIGFDRDGQLTYGPLWDALLTQIEDKCPELVVVDNIAQVFAGNENDRSQVTQFQNAIAGIAVEHDIGVLVVGHTAKSAGSEYSGSTAWENVVRSRWFMQREREKGIGGTEGEETGRTILAKRKVNNADRDELILKYDRGYFALIGGAAIAEDMVTRLTREAREREAESAVAVALQWLAARNLRAHVAANSPDYLPRRMAEHNLVASFSDREIRAALTRMIGAQTVVMATIGRGPDRHQRDGLVLAATAGSTAGSDK